MGWRFWFWAWAAVANLAIAIGYMLAGDSDKAMATSAVVIACSAHAKVAMLE